MNQVARISEDRLRALVEDFRNLPAEMPWVEFKKNNYTQDVIGKSISALANSARLADKEVAYLVWGIKDETHEIVGSDFEPSKYTVNREPLEMWLAKMIDPCPHLTFHSLRTESGRVILLEIPAASHAPVTFNRQAHIRVGSATTLLSDHRDKESTLWSKIQAFAWEKGVAKHFQSASDVLELLDVRSYFDLTRQHIPSEQVGVLERLCDDLLIAPDVGGRWKITNLGAILFTTALDKFEGIDRKAVRVIEYEGKDRIRTKRRSDGNRGYASGFEGLMRHINLLLPLNEHIGQAFREERRIYPEIAVRELVANAVIHQDMTIRGSSPMIEIFEDRMEITNPGPSLNDPQRIIDLPPRSRNESLAALMRRMKICEEQGTGIDKAVNAAEIFQLPPPDFRTEGDNMKAVLLAPRQFGDMTQVERVRAAYQHAVLKVLANSKMTNSSLCERLGIAKQNAAQASRIIKDALAAGLIRAADPDAPRAGYVPHWA